MAMTKFMSAHLAYLQPPEFTDTSELEEQIEKLQAQVLELQEAGDSSAYLVGELCRRFLGWEGSDEVLAKRAADDYGEDGWIDELIATLSEEGLPIPF